MCIPYASTIISLYTPLFLNERHKLQLNRRDFLILFFCIVNLMHHQGYCGLLQGICQPCQSRGWGICKFWAARGPRARHLPTPNFWHARGFRYQNITTQRILLEKHADWLTSQGQEKIEEVCKGMFSILCMHFFMHCLLSQKYIEKSGAIDVNQRLYGYWIKFLWTLCEEHPFIFIKLFITVNFTAHY